jgi:hypothetical protein
VEANAGRLRFIEKASRDIYFEATGLPNLAPWFARSQAGIGSHFTYSTRGHVCVVTLGHMVYAFDPVEKRKLWDYNLYKPGTLEAPSPAQMVIDRDGRTLILSTDGGYERIGHVASVETGLVCLQSKNGLVAVDLVKGPTSSLWTRSDVTPRCHVFGDAEHIYVVDMNKEGKPTSTRAIRTSDGVSVALPDFTNLYAKRFHVHGHRLLVKDEVADGKVLLRVYDLKRRQDMLREEFPANSIVLRCPDAHMTGAVDPEGNVTVLDLELLHERVKFRVPQEELQKLSEAHVLTDRDLIYVALSKPMEARPGQQGDTLTNVHPGMGALRINGVIHAFDRKSGKPRWRNEFSNEMLILDQFGDNPLLLFTARYVRQQGQAVRQFQAVEGFDKRTGKAVWPPPDKKEMLHTTQQPFTALRVDPKLGVIELEQPALRMQFKAEAKEESKR